VQAYQALRQASADDRKWSLQQEAIGFLADAQARCGLSSQGPAPPLTEQLRSCISTAYDKQRSAWITRLPPVAVPEVSRQIDKHIALQRDLSEVGYLPTSAAIDGVYGPTTRAAIAAWQKARGHPATTFLSDEEARLLSNEATAHRGQPLGGQPTPVTSPSRPDAYSQGVVDWSDLKRWSDSQIGEQGTGVQYWEANRNVPGHVSCAEMAEKRMVGGADKSAFRAGCEEAKRRLDPIDDRRRTDPESRAGFNNEASIAPLKSTTALPSGTIVPPPNIRP
jgi:peptidoglycan hydrolase-like protein with peptidoglycan-binding domain